MAKGHKNIFANSRKFVKSFLRKHSYIVTFSELKMTKFSVWMEPEPPFTRWGLMMNKNQNLVTFSTWFRLRSICKFVNYIFLISIATNIILLQKNVNKKIEIAFPLVIVNWSDFGRAKHQCAVSQLSRREIYHFSELDL